MWEKFIKTLKKKSLTEQIEDKLIESLKMDKEMFTNAKFALRNKGNLAIAEQVIKDDKRINKSERTVRRKLLTHFAISDKIDIGSGFTITSIIIDIERIGDYAKNIADLAILMEDKFTCEVFDDKVKFIENKIEAMFIKTITAVENDDIELAREVYELYKKEISGECSLIKDSLIKDNENLSTGNAVAVALYLRYMKRIGAHLSNISTSVVNPFPRIGYKEKN